MLGLVVEVGGDLPRRVLRTAKQSREDPLLNNVPDVPARGSALGTDDHVLVPGARTELKSGGE